MLVAHQLLMSSDILMLCKIWWRKALFIGEVGLNLTRHRGTMGLHCATMSHKDPSWYDGYHRGTMRADPFPKFRRFSSTMPPHRGTMASAENLHFSLFFASFLLLFFSWCLA
jgi:hypothetical protein